jgi:hypothetical protein
VHYRVIARRYASQRFLGIGFAENGAVDNSLLRRSVPCQTFDANRVYDYA